jgi:hypothetical protein
MPRSPRRHISPGFPPAPWPIPVPLPPGEGGGGGGGGGGEPRESSRNMQGAEYLPIPMVYGRRWVGGRVFLVGSTTNNQLVVAYAISLAWNGIDAYEYIELDGKDIGTLGVNYNTYTGTQTTVDPLIQSAYPDHVERFTGLAYIVVRIDPYSQIFGGVPELRARVRGRKCYNPNTGTTVYTTNPVLHALDMLTAVDAGNIAWNGANYDQASWQSAATFCETVNNGQALYVASAIIDNQKTAIAHAKDILSEYFGDVLLTPDGKLKCIIYRDDIQPAYTIDDSYILSSQDRFDKQIQVSTILPDYAPTHVIAEYEDVNRNGEAARQQSISPVFEIGWQTYQPLHTKLQFTSDAITAKRLAHSIHMQSICDVRTVQFTTPQSVSAGDVAVLQDSNLSKTALKLQNSTLQIVPANHPTNELALAIIFIPRGSTWPTSATKLIDYGTSTVGFGVSLTSTGVRVRLAGNTYNFQLDNKTTNIPHTIALHWSSSTNRILLYHNDTPYSVTTSGVTSVNATGYNVVLGDGGYSFDIIQADLRNSWAYAPNFLGIFSYLNGSSTSNIILYNARGWVWGTPTYTPQYTAVYPVVFIKSVDYNTYNGLSNVTAETFRYLGRDSQYDESTSHQWVLYTESRASTSYPDPTQPPPAVINLWYTVQTIGAQGQTRYRATVGWAQSQSSFVRGYRVELTVGASTKILGEFGRNTNQCSFDIEDPQLTHSVTVYPVNNFGVIGSGQSIAFLPTSSAYSLSLDLLKYSNRPSHLHINADYWLAHVSWNVPSGLSAEVSVTTNVGFPLFHATGLTGSGGQYIHVKSEPGQTGDWVVGGFGGGSPSVCTVFGRIHGDSIYGTIKLSDGRSYSLSVSASSGSSTSPAQNLDINNSTLKLVSTDGKTIFNSTYMIQSGMNYIPNGSTSVWVAFPVPYQYFAPDVVITPRSNQLIWIGGSTTAGFSAVRSGTAGDLDFYWIAYGR